LVCKKQKKKEKKMTSTQSVVDPTKMNNAPIPSKKAFQVSTLYVGDLDENVDETTLYQLFAQVGSIESIRVCRESASRKSLGYGYVNFTNLQDAERALDTLNNTTLGKKSIRIMWCQKDPTLRKSGVGNVFIKNLDKKIQLKDLYDTFSVFGNILSCKIQLDEHGNSKGFGFIHFESAEAADKAIEKMNGMILGDDNEERIYVGRFIPKKERAKQLENTWTNVFIKNLPLKYADKDSFEGLFKHLGNIVSSVSRIPETANPKDPNQEKTVFGFVNFEKHEDAVKAVEEFNGKELEGKVVIACRAMKKHERENELRQKAEQLKLERIQKYQGLNLYVKNLDDEIDDEKLKQIFSKFGTITSAKVVTANNVSRGFGYVCFSTPEAASSALNELNGKIVEGYHKPLYVAFHEPRDKRREKLSSYFNRQKRQVPVGYPPYFQQPQMLPPFMARGRVVPMGVNNGQFYGPMRQGQQRQNQSRQPHHQAPPQAPLANKNQVGAMLYAKIFEITSSRELAAKITGMLLDQSWEKNAYLINDVQALKAKIEEAQKVIEESKKKAQTTTSE